jgi:hypothetical protein
MTTLTTPTLQRRLLQTVGEAVVHDRLGETVRLGAGVVRELRESVARMRREFEDDLAEGVEARSFIRSYGSVLLGMDESLVHLGGLLEELSGAEGTAAEGFLTELRLLKQESKAFRDLLAEALSRASEPPRPVDGARVRAAEEAHARPTDEQRERFRQLVGKWRKETAHLSSAARMAKHPAYQEVIRMGLVVVPLLLAELNRDPDFWFAALREITKENPVPAGSAGKVKEMARAWVEWGRKRGYIQ